MQFQFLHFMGRYYRLNYNAHSFITEIRIGRYELLRKNGNHLLAQAIYREYNTDIATNN